MTNNEEKVLNYLLGKEEFTSPTEIGNVVGGGDRHSAWASPICMRLVTKGVLERNHRGWYRNRKNV